MWPVAPSITRDKVSVFPDWQFPSMLGETRQDKEALTKEGALSSGLPFQTYRRISVTVIQPGYIPFPFSLRITANSARRIYLFAITSASAEKPRILNGVKTNDFANVEARFSPLPISLTCDRYASQHFLKPFNVESMAKKHQRDCA